MSVSGWGRWAGAARRRSGALLVLCLAGGAGCSDQTPAADPDAGPGGSAVTERISASGGGTIRIPGGATLEIPPGALARDTRITVTVPSAPTGNARYVSLEPRGLTFSKQVTLAIPFESVKDPLFMVFESSAGATLFTSSSGSEKTNWRLVQDAAWNSARGRLEVPLEHFTFVNAMLMVQELAYVALDIPDHLLNPGDIVMNLTHMLNYSWQKGPTWQPGHVGVVAALQGADPGSHALVVEATGTRVRRSWRSRFTGSEDLYLGARRPRGDPLSVGQRKAVASFVIQQVGKPYSIVGEGNINESSWSCVGLAEAALDKVGRGIIPWHREALVSTPFEMYAGSEAVHRVTVRAGQPLRIPVHGVVLHPASECHPQGGGIKGFYQNDQLYSMKAQLPQGAELKGHVGEYVLEWTPKLEQACTKTCPADGVPHLAIFTLTAAPSCKMPAGQHYFDPITVNERLEIRVLGHSGVYTISPLKPGQESTYTIDVEVPPEMKVVGRVFREDDTEVELMDAKGALTAAALAPYTNHTAKLIHEGKHPTRSGWYRIRWSIENTGSTAVGGSPKTWRYFVDYRLDRWLNEKEAHVP